MAASCSTPHARRRASARGVAAPSFICVAAFSSTAHAQNKDPFYYSQDAALTAGTVVARPGDDGSLWYNPAGLAAIEHVRVSASGSVLGVRVRSVPDALVIRLGGQEASLDLDSAELVASPNTSTLTLRVADGITVGAGTFVTVRDVRKSTDQVTNAEVSAAEGRVSQRLDAQSDTTKYHAGLGVGIDVGRGVRLGIAPFVTYRTDASALQYAIGVSGGGDQAFQVVQSSVSRTLVGFTGAVGMQADLGDGWHIGIVARPPELLLYRRTEGGGVTGIAGIEPGAAQPLQFEDASGDELEADAVAPARLTAGFMARLSPSLEVSGQLDAHSRLAEVDGDDARAPTVDASVGARATVSSSLVLGAGLFTDFSPVERLAGSLGAEDVDWFGGTLGGTLRTPLLARRDPRESGESGAEEAPLVLTTTLALRYAVGLGDVRAQVIDPGLSTPTRSVVFHDVMPFLGSSVQF